MFQYIVGVLRCGAAYFLVRSCFKQYPCRKKPQLCQKIEAKEQRSDSDSDSMKKKMKKKIGDSSFGVCSQFFRLVLLWVKKITHMHRIARRHITILFICADVDDVAFNMRPYSFALVFFVSLLFLAWTGLFRWCFLHAVVVVV